MKTNRYLADEWLARFAVRHEPTAYDYDTRLTRFFEWIGDTHVSDVTPAQVQAWIDRPRPRLKGAAAQPSSLAKDAAPLRGFYKFLATHYGMSYDPTADLLLPPIRNVNPKPVDDDVWQAVWGADWSALRATKDPLNRSLFEQAPFVLGMGYVAGLRREEIVDLEPAHFNLLRGEIVGLKRKGGNRDTVVPYAEMARIIGLRFPQLVPDAEGWVRCVENTVRSRLGSPRVLNWRELGEATPISERKHRLGEADLDPDWVNTKVRGWLRGVHLPQADWFTPHQLRHSAATNLARSGVFEAYEIMRLMNHTKIEVTMRYMKLATTDTLAEKRRRLEGGNAARYNRFAK